MLDANNVLRGPDLQDFPNVTFGKFIYDNLKEHEEDNALMTESQTGRICTSRELLQISTNVANGLLEYGITPGDVVCLIGSNTIAITSAAIGTLFLGGVINPLDPTMKSFEYQHMFGITEPKLIICDADVLPVIEQTIKQMESEVPIISLQENENGYKTLEDIMSESDIDAFKPYESEELDELAVIVGSSGTTGLPKGVGLTHRNYVFQAILGEAVLRKVLKTFFLHTSHFFWVSGLFAFAASMATGLRRILVEEVNDLNVLKAIEKYKPYFTMSSPSLINSLLHNPETENYDISPLRVIFTAGSPLQKSTVDLIKEKWGEDVRVTQAYGLSEVAGAYLLPVAGTDPLSVGMINTGTAIKVVDVDTGENLPCGKEGELHLQSVGMMKGYVKNPEATAEALDEDGWLHTGDIGYINEEGLIYITGRMKELLKLDNHQIAPAEIEQVINTVPGVADVGVAGIQVTPENAYPMALVVKEEDSDVSEEEIIKCVNENLSEFKQLKGGVCFVDNIPRTTTGKIKRRILQEMADTLYMGGSEGL